MLKLTDSIEKLPLIGYKYKNLLEKLGVFTIKDLLYYFPVRHIDTSKLSKISELDTLDKKTVLCMIDNIKNFRTKSRLFITEAKIHDDSGNIDVIWFNQPFLSKTIKVGSNILLNGKLNPKRNKPQLYSPSYETTKNSPTTHLGIISPVYPTTEGITSKWIRSRIKFLFTKYSCLLDNIETIVPQTIQESYDLVDLKGAIGEIHFPKDLKSLKDAKKRLAFEELLVLQLQLTKRIKKRQRQKSPKIVLASDEIKVFLKNLDFNPTAAQIKAINEITSDFKRKYPANRLLQGDVGCGKTLVAAAISIPVIKSGFQVAVMTPTAILARQHYKTFNELFNNSKYKIKLVTGATKSIEKTSMEQYNIIIGTHALLHRLESLFSKLGLVIIDEQHRFGVKQRETLVSLNKKKYIPHKVTMTATPIPRSIALTLFGDLDISIIDEMPPGRTPTKTYLVPGKKRCNSYEWIEKIIKKNKSQVFWICPLIEESDKLQTKAVITEYEKLENKIFPKLRIELLHGKLSEEEKNDKILRMKQGKIDILVSTSVIEVGMDIPDANIIVIEGAERFGLAQLHQFRGRVGRRANQASWCFLFSSKNASSEAVKRLKYFTQVNDGLKVAEFDLENRGPGEVYGTKQSGIPDLKIANLRDITLIKQTKEAAELILDSKI